MNKRRQKFQRRKQSRFFNIVVTLLVLGSLATSVWFFLAVLRPVTLPEENIQFVIESGEGVNQISINLYDASVIKSKLAFETYAYLKDIEGDFIAGEYTLPGIVNIKHLTEILTTGQEAEEWKLTMIEGWTTRDLAWHLENQGRFQAGEVLEATGVSQPSNQYSIDISDYEFLLDKPESANLEGYLFPDTYYYFNYATIDDILRKMFNNFDRKLTREMREDIRRQDKTIFEVVTMASIVEREVMSDEDKRIVAGIFWKRLDSGMPLQADSTVNYVTGKKTPSVSYADLEIDSLYNTYKYPGLTPGPISNPGLASIEATIYPKESEYWFFLTDEDGNVHYARDFEGHISNKNKYLK